MASVDGKEYIDDEVIGDIDQGESIGVDLANRLLDKGGKSILDQIRNAQ